MPRQPEGGGIERGAQGLGAGYTGQVLQPALGVLDEEGIHAVIPHGLGRGDALLQRTIGLVLLDHRGSRGRHGAEAPRTRATQKGEHRHKSGEGEPAS
jgi:hypothetical protein